MNGKSVATKVPFSDLCKVCEKTSLKQGKGNKEKILKDFIHNWRDFHSKLHGNNPNTEDSFYSALRLLLPQFDKERGAYGIKEVLLAKLYIEILCLGKDSPDAQKLLNYRSPGSARNEAGDFANVAYFVLKNRCPEKSSLTIQDVNDCLDAIAINNASRNKDVVKKNLLHLMKCLTALEQKWLIRMIMKSLRFGLSEHTVLNAFHIDAKKFYDVCNNLPRVCRTLHDVTVRLHEIDISLFAPFRPMLAETANPNKIEKLLDKGKFFVETKYDGERMQLHMDQNKFKYFSRNANDFTDSFGPSSVDGPFTKYISTKFSSSVRNCILDGEMVGYNMENDHIGSKGENFDVKALKDGDDYQQCYCVFDIVLYNDQVLTSKPLQERVAYLKDLFTPVKGRLILAPRREIKNKQDAVEALNEAIDNREEGIVVKNAQSSYKPNARKEGWYKIKPEYVDNLMEQVDLLIIGGYFGEGRRSGLISHFLLGVAVPSKKQNENPKEFHSFCRVGSGYTFKELFDLCLKLNKHWMPYDRRNPPPNVIIGSGHKERPDLWIEPSNSHIVQIKAAEIIRSDKFMTGCTLRFPRVEKVRYDKSWFDCLTTTDLQQLQQQSEGKLALHMHGDGSDGEPTTKKRRVTPRYEKPSLASRFKGIDPTTVEKVSDILAGKEFYVINGPSEYNKQELEKLILKNGGGIVQNPDSNTYCVLAHEIVVRVRNIIDAGKYDVVKTEWLLHCVEECQLLKWTPSDMWHSTPSTAVDLAKDYDRYGDHYLQSIDECSIRSIFEEVGKQDFISLSSHEIAELENEYFPNSSQIGLFRLCRIYFDRYQTIGDEATAIQNSVLEINEIVFTFYGGQVDARLTDKTTHVILDENNVSRIAQFRNINRRQTKKFFLVTNLWLKQCIDLGCLVPEKSYEPA